jgi:hypothetical protein
MKRLLILLMIIVMGIMPVSAKNNGIIPAKMASIFSTTGQTPSVVAFSPNRNLKINDELTLPSRAIIAAEVYRFQKEKRMHRHGYIVCRLLSYKDPDSNEVIDLLSKDIFVVARRRSNLELGEAALTGVELTVTTAASIPLPGVDIVYYFTKGAILRGNNPNWFKSGVSEAYDNSIFWFFLKGRTIDFEKGDYVDIKHIGKEEVLKLRDKIDENQIKTEQREAVKFIKKQKKIAKAEEKRAARIEKQAQKIVAEKQKQGQQTTVEDEIQNIIEKEQQIQQAKEAKLAAKAEAKKLKQEQKAAKKAAKAEAKKLKQEQKAEHKTEVKTEDKTLNEENKAEKSDI